MIKLSEIRGEEAVDLLADILDPLSEIAINKKVQEVINGKQPRIVIAKTVLKNCKKEAIEILALLNGEDPETYAPSLLVLPKMVIEIMNDEELVELFHSREQMTEGEPSGPAMENTGAEETK